MRKMRTTPVQYEEALQVSREIKAQKYLECSALTQRNLKSVFDEAIRYVNLEYFWQRNSRGSNISIPEPFLTQDLHQRHLAVTSVPFFKSRYPSTCIDNRDEIQSAHHDFLEEDPAREISTRNAIMLTRSNV
jgi:hypothetical protein